MSGGKVIPFYDSLDMLEKGARKRYKLKEKDPGGAEFAVRLHGTAMGPDFPDGCIVFCDHGELSEGDIGIFQIDSGTVCMQYYKDPFGFVYLFRLSPKPRFADYLIRRDGKQKFACQGRVITQKCFPVPGRG